MVKSRERKGFFGEYGGVFVPPELEKVLECLAESYVNLAMGDEFKEELNRYLDTYVGRPSPIYYAKNLSEEIGGARIYFKREDLNHTGSHKINNTMGQALLAKKTGKKRVIAETGAGQHGVATATASTLLGLECTVYMGSEDMRRQALNVFRMELLGAEVVPVNRGTKTLKDAVDAAIEDLLENYDETYYLLGSAVGPHPYPTMVRDFQSVIGREAKEQMQALEGRYPDYLVACVGGGSNAIGLFHPFLEHEEVKIIGVEPAGRGLDTLDHAASITMGKPGIIHGFRCYTIQDEEGEIQPVHSIAAGLDYPGVGPEHSNLKDTRRAEYTTVTDQEALEAFQVLSRVEGITPALESAHAVAYVMKLGKKLNPDEIILVNLSGRGDKDVAQVAEFLKE